MKPTDTITVEITLAELAKIYAIMGKANGSSCTELYWLGQRTLDPHGHARDAITAKIPKEKIIDYNSYESAWIKTLFNVKTEQELKLEELEKTIAKAQEEIQQLKGMR